MIQHKGDDIMVMKALRSALLALLMIGTVALPRAAGAADKEAFVAAYRKAFEAKDTAALEGFLYGKGADPVVLDLYKSKQAQQAGAKVTSIELVEPTPAEAAEAAKPKDGPSGKLALTVIPTRSWSSKSRPTTRPAARRPRSATSLPRSTASSSSRFRDR